MVIYFIISAILFTIGNIIWNNFGINDPHYFYIPLALQLWIGAWTIKNWYNSLFKANQYISYLLDYVWLLAAGNVVKQVCYDYDDVKKINDYVFGSVATVRMLFLLGRYYFIQRKKNNKWETRIKSSGKK
jgi:hypothetical protein